VSVEAVECVGDSCGRGRIIEKSARKGFAATRNLCVHQMT
jgi:hypothetical protein